MNPTMSRDQVEHEARAKIFWGDEPQTVINFLRMNGLPYEEAEAIVGDIVRERMANIRGSGIRNIATGAFLVAIPVAVELIFMSRGKIYVSVILILLGLWGLWNIVKGIMMLISPEIQKGDLTDDMD
jgi:hypothetical protein